MSFIGQFPVRLDAKNRAFMPAGFRRQLQQAGEQTLVVRKDYFENCLVIYPASQWQQEIAGVRARLNRFDGNQQMVYRKLVSEAQEVQLDRQFTGSQQMMNRWMGIQQLQMSLAQMANASGNMISQMVQAKATMEGAEQTQHNEQLDQIKDLFSQAETLIQAVIQLMQAVLSAENDSLMEAIRA